ncbi:MAG: HNH endonuclease [Acidaminococcaceae bacterium]|nr:HNH endonuclease [Acidaminococcaceae bacterium]
MGEFWESFGRVWNEVTAVLKSCSFCGKVHDFNAVCPKRIEYERRRSAQYDRRQYVRDSKADKFRSTQAWQRKRNEVRERDLNVCRCCFLVHHRITTEGLSVHHIIPIERAYSRRLSNNNLITLCRECHEQAEKGAMTPSELAALLRQPIRL